MTTDPKCPFCLAVHRGIIKHNYDCGTWGKEHLSIVTWHRDDRCYTRQLAQQAEVLKECLEVVRWVAEALSPRFIGDKAASLIPRLEKILEVK